jgi:hypothetical protein
MLPVYRCNAARCVLKVVVSGIVCVGAWMVLPLVSPAGPLGAVTLPYPTPCCVYTHAQAEQFAQYAGPRNAAIVHTQAGAFTVRFDTGGYKTSEFREGAWHTTTYSHAYYLHVQAKAGCISFFNGGSADVEMRPASQSSSITSSSEMAHVFAGPQVTYTYHHSLLCAGSKYTAKITTSNFTTDFVDHYHIQPRNTQTVEFTLRTKRDVDIPLPTS